MFEKLLPKSAIGEKVCRMSSFNNHLQVIIPNKILSV